MGPANLKRCMNDLINTGASEIKISCFIEERDADRALNILHNYLFTFLD